MALFGYQQLASGGKRRKFEESSRRRGGDTFADDQPSSVARSECIMAHSERPPSLDELAHAFEI